MIRHLHPLDLFSLLLLDGRTSHAHTRERLGRPPGRFEPFRHGLVRPGGHVLVAERWGRLQGLVSVRERGGQAWEVEQLCLAPGQEETASELLESLAFHGADLRVEKVFLRLPASSPLLEAACQAGFAPYLTEFLYYIVGWGHRGDGPPSFRPRTPQDDSRIFQLASLVVPAVVRQAEGPSFEEWQGSRELPGCRELVWDQGNQLWGWLRIRSRGRAGYFDLLLHPMAQNALEPVLEGTLDLLQGRSPILSLVPEYQESLRRELEERGFREEARFAILVRPTTARMKQPQFIPMRA